MQIRLWTENNLQCQLTVSQCRKNETQKENKHVSGWKGNRVGHKSSWKERDMIRIKCTFPDQKQWRHPDTALHLWRGSECMCWMSARQGGKHKQPNICLWYQWRLIKETSETDKLCDLKIPEGPVKPSLNSDSPGYLSVTLRTASQGIQNSQWILLLFNWTWIWY